MTYGLFGVLISGWFKVLRFHISDEGIDVTGRIVIRSGRHARRHLREQGQSQPGNYNKDDDPIHGRHYNPTRMTASVRALFVMPQKKAKPVSLEQVSLSKSGFDGDFHAKESSSRQ